MASTGIRRCATAEVLKLKSVQILIKSRNEERGLPKRETKEKERQKRKKRHQLWTRMAPNAAAAFSDCVNGGVRGDLLSLYSLVYVVVI